MMKILLILFWGIPFSAMNGYAMGDREPENSISQLRCHTEEVRSSGDDPVLENDCTRFVCGPTYVGKIGFDSCYEAERIIEGEGEDAITVKTGYVRLPGRENSSEEWEEIVVQTGPEAALTCGRYYVPPEEEIPEEETSSIFDRLVPDLLAQVGSGSFSPESVIGPTDIPWSEEQKRLVADKFNELASRIFTAIEANNPLEVGGPNTEHHAYTIATWETAKWLAHALSPQTYPCYPGTFEGLNTLIHPGEPAPPANCAAVAGGASFSGPGFLIYWVPCEGNNCYGAAAYGLNLIKVNQNYQPSEGDTGAALANLLIHEGLHTLSHFQDTFRAESYVSSLATIPPDSTAFTLYALISPMGGDIPLSLSEIVPSYSDESSARVAELILFHFMNDSDRLQVELILRRLVWDPNVNFRLLRLSTHLARQNFIPPPYAYKWEWWRMSDDDRLRHGNSFSTWLSRCSNFDPVKMIAELETLYHTQGGFLGLPPGYQGTAAQTGAALGMSSQPGLDHDTTESPDSASLCEGPVPSSEEEIAVEVEVEVPADCEVTSTSTVSTASWSAQEEVLANCEPPDCEENLEECEENPEEEPEEPDPTDEVPECVLYYDDYLIENQTVGTSCYTWCWENNEIAPGLCEHLREDDRSSNCDLSGGVACRQAKATGCQEHPERDECLTGCRRDSNRPYCDAVCGLGENYQEPFCHDRCLLVDHRPNYCGLRCREDANQDYCIRRCEDRDGGVAYCGEVCRIQSQRGEYEMCDDWCRSQPPGDEFCFDICVNGGLAGRMSYCDTICEEQDDASYCCRGDWCCQLTFSGGTTCCAAADCGPPEPPPPPPPPSGGGSGSSCPSGWTYPDGLQLLSVINDGCFPFVGNVKCCGSNCEPNGSNHACVVDEYCGCPTGEGADLLRGWCTDPVSGLFCGSEWMWCDGVCMGSAQGGCVGTYVPPTDNYHCACNWDTSCGDSGCWGGYDAERCRTWDDE